MSTAGRAGRNVACAEGMVKSGDSVPEILISLHQPAQHALQGLIHLARRGPGEACLARAAARARGLPADSLAKTFQRLARRGLLTARRGPGGGYALARDPRRITAADIVAAAGEESAPRRCLMEDRRCGTGRGRCALHEAATKADAIVRRRLEALTLADLAALEPRDDARRGGK